MITNGISVVQVNLYSVKQIKEIKDNSQLKVIGETILVGILAEMGYISRFDDVKEIQKLNGLDLIVCSLGRCKEKPKISYRGCKRLRYWLLQASKSLATHSDAFKELHVYDTTRAEELLKKM